MNVFIYIYIYIYMYVIYIYTEQLKKGILSKETSFLD